MLTTRSKPTIKAITSSSAPALDTEIFLRIWQQQNLTPTLARHLLKLQFDAADEARMHELASKNQDGKLTPGELAEFDQFIRVGAILTILQSRARKFLRKTNVPRNRA
jgi:hypothetical protein